MQRLKLDAARCGRRWEWGFLGCRAHRCRGWQDGGVSEGPLCGWKRVRLGPEDGALETNRRI